MQRRDSAPAERAGPPTAPQQLQACRQPGRTWCLPVHRAGLASPVKQGGCQLRPKAQGSHRESRSQVPTEGSYPAEGLFCCLGFDWSVG